MAGTSPAMTDIEKKPRGMRGASEEGVIDAFDSGMPPKQHACY